MSNTLSIGLYVLLLIVMWAIGVYILCKYGWKAFGLMLLYTLITVIALMLEVI